ncbi:glycosyltransferase family 32 protein [Rhizobium sp. SSA_523]|uniref:glycosyltransferase family 32 protein n=1 Tax=Rhizobium sp. SSA_523 TaxID=2952477 RepID=UPI0020915097|nr:glycosyltransferase [Rhizobium sp. SSA_523]MCO5732353.1 mannosyltransferase [Rhizobium sp. SSA_523]WKC21249.1 glycosyltransferase [Rhizobium sp. SSA_523]
MTPLESLRQIRAAIAAGDHGAARTRLDQLAADAQEDAALGPRTMLGLPRKVHSTYLKLAKAERRTVERMGLQQSLVPPPELLAPFIRFTSAERRAMNAINREPVPRILHQIWIGSLPLPQGSEAWRDHAQAHGLTYRLWREEDLSQLGVMEDPVFAHMLAAGDYPGAVDLARYAVLAAEGGIYLDCDWYPARDDVSFADLLPMTGLAALAEDTPRATGMGSLLLSNAFIMIPAGHPVFQRMLAILPEVIRLLPDGPAWWSTGPLIMTLLMRGTSVLVADAGLVSRTLPRRAAFAAVEEARAQTLADDGGLLIGWKSW